MTSMPSLEKLDINDVVSRLRRAYKQWAVPTVTQIAFDTENPFKILVSTVLSARTKDETTEAASARLFSLADTPEKMVKLDLSRIEKAIFPVGFYHTKAKNVKKLCRQLLDDYGGKVPDTVDELIKLPGVGRKTANLVVTLAFRKHGICVDTHVHRISNRMGFVKTRTPKETEFALYEVLPKRHWMTYNDLLVAFGQNLCRPISPHCSKCPVGSRCPRIGVEKSR